MTSLSRIEELIEAYRLATPPHETRWRKEVLMWTLEGVLRDRDEARDALNKSVLLYDQARAQVLQLDAEAQRLHEHCTTLRAQRDQLNNLLKAQR